MERREFIITGTCAAMWATDVLRAQAASKGQEVTMPRDSYDIYELRRTRFPKNLNAIWEKYCAEVIVPGCHRLGLEHVGVFRQVLMETQDQCEGVLLLCCRSWQEYAKITELSRDKELQEQVWRFAEKHPEAGVVLRWESTLLQGIDAMSRLELPPAGSALFNLRIYESPHLAAGAKKIEMFQAGELAIFRRVGLTPVLFGKALSGSALPNLTYLLAFPDDLAREQAWNRFRNDPEWQEMRARPEYADKRLLTQITNVLLEPLKCSML